MTFSFPKLLIQICIKWIFWVTCKHFKFLQIQDQFKIFSLLSKGSGNEKWKENNYSLNNNNTWALDGVAQWLEHRLRTKGSPVRFPVRARTWAAGQVSRGGHVRGNHTLLFLSLSFSLPSPLSKNKWTKSLKKMIQIIESREEQK